jgi:hypothetical protein
MAVPDWAILVGCAAGLGFMTHALLRGGVNSTRKAEPVRPVAFVLDFASERRPFAENRLTEHRVTEHRVVEPR